MVRPAKAGSLCARPFGRGMRAVRGGERVVDENIAERGEFLHEARLVLLFLLVEACILQAEDVAGLHRVDRGLGLLADASSAKATGRAESLGDRRRDRLERLVGIDSLWPAEMSEQDHFAALVGDLGDGRRHALDARCVADLAVLHRHVEVDAQQHALALTSA